MMASLMPFCDSNCASKGLGSEKELCTITRNSSAALAWVDTEKAANAVAARVKRRRFMAKPFNAPTHKTLG